MPVIAVIGGQWGDEGKGKGIGDLLEKENIRVTARGTGGPNAGHTLFKGDDEIKFHCTPSGLIIPDTVDIIGKGMVVPITLHDGVTGLYDEILYLENKGIDVKGRLLVSDRTHMILPHYVDIEEKFEQAMTLGERKGIGTTRKGIGVAYFFKAARAGVTYGDILHDDKFKERLTINSQVTKLFGLEVDPNKLRDDLLFDFEKVAKYITISQLPADKSAGVCQSELS